MTATIKDSDYQVVTLTLADGKRCSYTGRVQMDMFAKVVGVEVTPGKRLPDGMTWDILPSGEDGVIDEGDA